MPIGLGVPELLIVLLILIMLFGVGRLSQLGSTLGKSIRDFRGALRGEDNEEGSS